MVEGRTRGRLVLCLWHVLLACLLRREPLLVGRNWRLRYLGRLLVVKCRLLLSILRRLLAIVLRLLAVLRLPVLLLALLLLLLIILLELLDALAEKEFHREQGSSQDPMSCEADANESRLRRRECGWRQG